MKRYELHSGKKTISKEEMFFILTWCKRKLGRSKYFSIRKLKLVVDNRIKFLGHFDIDNNIISINPSRHKNILELVETIIHEYVHFLQNPKEYDRLSKMVYRDYFDHPHEKEAEKIAIKLAPKCLKNLKNKIK